jgi:hypothetical protein
MQLRELVLEQKRGKLVELHRRLKVEHRQLRELLELQLLLRLS